MSILNDSQRKVFEATLKIGKSTIGKIAQKTGMHRQSVKIILVSLQEKGFVSKSSEGNKIFFSSNDLNDIKKKFLSQLECMKKQVPALKAEYEDTKDSQIINAVSGVKGLRSALMDEIIKGKEICAFHLSCLSEEFSEEFEANDKRRVIHKIPLRVLTNHKSNQKSSKNLLYKQKGWSVQSKIDLFVYANKLTIFYSDTETKIFTMKINEITTLFKDIFEKKWKAC